MHYNMVGESEPMRDVHRLIRKVAPTDVGVFICGESGTGKEMVARAIHRHSRRSEGPLEIVNCGAVPPTLLESALFGHVRGAFTGAIADKAGLFGLADGGTLFLDEVLELPVDCQTKLLRALEEGKIRRVGDTSDRAVDEDEEGDTATSEVESVTVSSMPDPPSGLDWTWDADTATLTLTWQASPSPDVASYRVRRGEDLLSGNSEPVQDSPDLEYVPVIEAGTTGVLIFSVRAVDADGNEEGNVSQVMAIPFEDGAPAARPAEPRWVEARAIEDSRIELEWLYDPRYEDYGPGAAAEARIYWDAGTGEIDFSEPHATVEMGYPTEATRYTWQSAPLTDGQTYRFTIRIATAPWPDGIEAQNADSHAATADADQPSALLPAVRVI